MHTKLGQPIGSFSNWGILYSEGPEFPKVGGPIVSGPYIREIDMWDPESERGLGS